MRQQGGWHTRIWKMHYKHKTRTDTEVCGKPDQWEPRHRVSGTCHCCCKAHKDREKVDTGYGWQDLHVALKGKQGLAMHLKQITVKNGEYMYASATHL